MSKNNRETREQYLIRIEREEQLRHMERLVEHKKIDDIRSEIMTEHMTGPATLDVDKLAAILHKLGYEAWTT